MPEMMICPKKDKCWFARDSKSICIHSLPHARNIECNGLHDKAELNGKFTPCDGCISYVPPIEQKPEIEPSKIARRMGECIGKYQAEMKESNPKMSKVRKIILDTICDCLPESSYCNEAVDSATKEIEQLISAREQKAREEERERISNGISKVLDEKMDKVCKGELLDLLWQMVRGK